jgi:hypothetical protein
MKTLFACLLVLLGSGDDFNFARLVIRCGQGQLPAGGLPLDDPNTDVTPCQRASATRGRSAWGRGGQPSPAANSPARRTYNHISLLAAFPKWVAERPFLVPLLC